MKGDTKSAAVTLRPESPPHKRVEITSDFAKFTNIAHMDVAISSGYEGGMVVLGQGMP